MPRPGGARPSADGAAAPAVTGEPERLAMDATVDIEAVRAELGVDRTLEELDATLVGLVPVKRRLREVEALLLVDRAPRSIRARHAAAQPAHVLRRAAGDRQDDCRHQDGRDPPRPRLPAVEPTRARVTRDDLVGPVRRPHRPQDQARCSKRAMGGVLFIDEAYALHRPDNERDYGQEAIEILLQVMEEHRDRLVVILAGYGDRMDGVLRPQPRLAFPDRPPHRLPGVRRRRSW